MFTEADFRINPTVYEWTGRTIALLGKFLKVNIKLHHHEDRLRAAEILVFNHFARFETFIPQYLLYREIGALSRSVASAEFFEERDPFSSYLLSLGAVPTDQPGLLPFLGAEVLRGRKVILFPEGGMVKDRRVLDAEGHYNVYSRISKERRKHHTGAAVVALAVSGFKAAVRAAEAAGDADRLEFWTETLGLDDPAALTAAARRPTLVVPCNITFYPIRISQNFLRRAAEVFNLGLSPRAAEELLIEGNILLRDTDMDIAVGEPVRAEDLWTAWDRLLMRRVTRRCDTIADWVALGDPGGGPTRRLYSRRLRRNILRLRDAYMKGMYTGVTVNLSHLASGIAFQLLDDGVTEIDALRFRRIAYLAVKGVQEAGTLHLHRSLRNPETYAGLWRGECAGLDQLLETAGASRLMEVGDGSYRFLDKLCQEHDIDRVRTENPLAVYANEVAPLPTVRAVVDRAIVDAARFGPEQWALLRFDDEKVAYRWDRAAFRKPRHEEVNRAQAVTASGAPFFRLPGEGRKRLGVLLVHGFTASPAEVGPFGERLAEAGFPVLGVRLKGHGTSPWDLHERSWEDWYRSVRTGYEILEPFVDQICLVGFSAGGALCLRLAAERPEALCGTVAVCAPVRLRDKAMTIVPLVHGANVVVEAVSAARGIKLFHPSEPEHPHINYRQMPVNALYELGQLIDAFRATLAEVRCPVLLIQSDGDPTVEPTSVDAIAKSLVAAPTRVAVVSSERHGILYEDVGGTQDQILEFLVQREGKGRG